MCTVRLPNFLPLAVTTTGVIENINVRSNQRASELCGPPSIGLAKDMTAYASTKITLCRNIAKVAWKLVYPITQL